MLHSRTLRLCRTRIIAQSRQKYQRNLVAASFLNYENRLFSTQSVAPPTRKDDKSIRSIEKNELWYENYDDDENNQNTPWKTLLGIPARAAWRSTTVAASSADMDSYDGDDLSSNLVGSTQRYTADTAKQALLNTCIRRTAVQIRKAHEDVLQQHKALAMRRENERIRLITNNKNRQTRNDTKLSKEPIPVSYGPDEALQHIQYRLMPQYAIVKRVLQETKSLLMTTPTTTTDTSASYQWKPKRILDFGIGCGSASAAALDVFENEIEWIHGIDPSKTMREASQFYLQEFMQQKSQANIPESEIDSSRSLLNQTIVTVSAHLSTSSLSFSVSQQAFPEESGAAFDLAIMAYTASELTHTSATLAAAALLWEKLQPNGIFVMIEPGTPDGFTSIRTVRNMLLDCVNNQHHDGDPIDSTADEEDDWNIYKKNASVTVSSPPEKMNDEMLSVVNGEKYGEECHVIAPCTHNGACPMDQFHRIKKNITENSKENRQPKHSQQKNEIEECEVNKKSKADGNADDSVSDSDDEIVEGNGYDNSIDEADDYQEEMTQPGFCSFVQTMSGSSGKKSHSFGSNKGEKFSYLVVQKRVTDRRQDAGNIDAIPNKQNCSSMDRVPFEELHVVDLLRRTLQHQQQLQTQHRLAGDDGSSMSNELMEEASQIENRFLSSTDDPLCLELLRGDMNRQSFGRIIRAPKKKMRHVLIDLCCAPGLMTRHVVQKSLTSTMPGIYSAARKSRWGGFWPNVPSVRRKNDSKNQK